MALVAILGVVYLVNNYSLNKDESNNTSKSLGTTIEREDNRQNEQAILNENKVEENTNKNTEKMWKKISENDREIWRDKINEKNKTYLIVKELKERIEICVKVQDEILEEKRIDASVKFF